MTFDLDFLAKINRAKLEKGLKSLSLTASGRHQGGPQDVTGSIATGGTFLDTNYFAFPM